MTAKIILYANTIRYAEIWSKRAFPIHAINC